MEIARTAKKAILVIAALVACCALVAGGSLAFFTADEKTHNIITSHNVDITLWEWADEGKTVPFPKGGISGALPDKSITKIVEVENTGGAAAWVRIKVDKGFVDANNQPLNADVVAPSFPDGGAGSSWTKRIEGGVEWWYYAKALEPGKTTEPLFKSVVFSKTMGNAYQNGTASVVVTAQAVQVANNGSSALDATGWPDWN